MNRLGFRRALVLVVSVLLLLSLLITIVMSDQLFKTTTIADLRRTILNSASYEAIRIANHVEKSAQNATGVAALYDTYKDQIPIQDIAKIAAVSGSVHKVTIGFEDGRAYASKHDINFPGGIADLNRYDPRTRPWFKYGRSLSGLALSDVFFTTKSQEPMLGALQPIDKGVVLVDIRLTHMKSLLKKIKVVKGAVGALTDGNGTILESTAEFLPIRETLGAVNVTSALTPSIMANDDTFNYVVIDGKEYVLVSKQINLVAGVNWYLLIAVDKETAFAQVNAAAWKLRSLALVIGAVSILLLLFVLARLYKPVLELKSTVEQLAEGEGDLTSRLTVKSDDDLGDIARGVNAIISNLQSMMTEVQSVTIQLSNGVNELRQHEQQTSEILKDHYSETEQVVTAVEKLSSTAMQVSEHAQRTVNFTQEADTVADTSKGNIVSAQNNLQNLVQEVAQTRGNITAMNDETQGIASILSVIGGIAEQTNLLALNAAIEAARAGEQGRGFAVVADEVRALANKTQHSTSEIEEALEALKGRASTVVTAIERTSNASQDSVAEAQVVASNLGDLIGYVSQINELNVLISSSANEQYSVIQEINMNMSHIHQMVDEINDKGERMRNETESIESLNKKLVGLVSKFKLV